MLFRSDYGSAKVTPQGYVFNVSVRGEHRGQGHGTALMEEIAEHADALGRPLKLNAREDLHPWYRRLGYEPDTGPSAGIETQIMGAPLLVRPPKEGRRGGK